MIVFDNAIREARQELDSDYAYYLEETAIDDAQQYDSVYLHAQRTGLIFTVYAIVEAYLNRTCKFCHSRFACELKPKEVAGKGVRRSSLYLSKVVQCNSNIFKAEFDNMFVLGDLRNVLVHADGQVEESQKGKIERFKTYAQKYGSPFRIESDGKVVLSSSSAEHFIDRSEALVKAIGQALVDRAK